MFGEKVFIIQTRHNRNMNLNIQMQPHQGDNNHAAVSNDVTYLHIINTRKLELIELALTFNFLSSLRQYLYSIARLNGPKSA